MILGYTPHTGLSVNFDLGVVEKVKVPPRSIANHSPAAMMAESHAAVAWPCATLTMPTEEESKTDWLPVGMHGGSAGLVRGVMAMRVLHTFVFFRLAI